MSEYIYVGLDVHQDSITVAILYPGSDQAEVIRLSGDLMKIRRLFRRLAKKGPIRSCYEASGAGFVLHRVLKDDGFHCDVIAPSLIPRKPGDRRKTDRLDAVNLARLYRSGHLTPVHVPSKEQVELRQLIRLRNRYQQQAKSTKLRITSVLRTHGYRFTVTKTLWTKKHRIWLEEMRRELTGPLQIVIAAELEHHEYLEMQRQSFDAEIERYAQSPTYQAAVEVLCCIRGIKTLTAMTILCEVGDVRRFDSPRRLAAYLGLVPSERSSGEIQRRGPITKAGNSNARRLLVEAAWNNRHRSGANLILNRRRQGQPPEVVAIALKAQHRLSKRFNYLHARGKHVNVAITAVAREMCGFIWAALHALPNN
jgi:transposase